MKVCAFQTKPHIHSPNKNAHLIHSPKLPTNPSPLKLRPTTKPSTTLSIKPSPKPISHTSLQDPNRAHQDLLEASQDGIPRWALLGGASLAFAFLVLGGDGHQEALAFGPEGPLVEEFWENMRRYGLYILTVSSGAIYTILQPIVELLKNPITAILIITVLAGGFYLVSQVLSLMVGISDFSYKYGY